MQCSPSLVAALSWLLAALGLLTLWLYGQTPSRYGKHEQQPEEEEEEEAPAQHLEGAGAGAAAAAAAAAQKPPGSPLPPARRSHVPARCAWFLQELPAFLVPAFLLALRRPPRFAPLGCRLLGGMFCGHYFHRTFIYSFLTRGKPFPLQTLFFGMLFCVYNGFLQGYYMIYCAEYPDDWYNDIRFTSGTLLFFFGMGVNIHSDLLLRQLRKPGEFTYKIPQGGLFAYVSGANFFGEILEWFGYAIATWSLPAFAFALFTVCFIGPRAYHHHRYYLRKFTCYPRTRKALIPFVF